MRDLEEKDYMISKLNCDIKVVNNILEEKEW